MSSLMFDVFFQGMPGVPGLPGDKVNMISDLVICPCYGLLMTMCFCFRVRKGRVQ